jgi:hypothetical protein
MRKRKGRLESSDNDDVVDRDANPLPLLAPEGVNASDDGRDKKRMHPTTERNIIRRIAVDIIFVADRGKISNNVTHEM